MSCPICGKPTRAAYRPFCSKRCADIDLGRWLNDAYQLVDDAETDSEQHVDSLTNPRER